jgi:cytosine/adenosine deaminase-related metal-dependent hydrolase
MAADLLVRDVRPLGGDRTDILISAGCIERGPAPAGVTVLDGGGRIALPGLVEAHTHLDKSLLGHPWYHNEVGPRLIDRIENERNVRKSLPIDPRRQSERHALLSVSHGSTFIRSHVDVDTECGLAGVEGVMATREALAGIVDIDLVAFPQSGLLVRPGTVELLEQALRLGAETVGGLDPCAIDRDPKGHLDTVFGLADKFGCGVDIHLHEPGDMGAFSMGLIIERTITLGMQGKVIISHAFCLGMPDASVMDPLIAALAETRIAIMTTGTASQPVPPLKRLVQAGVVVCAGSDGIRDTWGPYGNADMLERAMFVGQRYNLRRDDELALALDVVTTGGAQALGLEDYGLSPGCRGDLVLVEAENLAESRCTAAGAPHGGQARPCGGPRWGDCILMRRSVTTPWAKMQSFCCAPGAVC